MEIAPLRQFRLDLLKKIVVYGTLILWIGIWMATRGEEKASFGNLMQDISNSWKKTPSHPSTDDKAVLDQ